MKEKPKTNTEKFEKKMHNVNTPVSSVQLLRNHTHLFTYLELMLFCRCFAQFRRGDQLSYSVCVCVGLGCVVELFIR